MKVYGLETIKRESLLTLILHNFFDYDRLRFTYLENVLTIL